MTLIPDRETNHALVLLALLSLMLLMPLPHSLTTAAELINCPTVIISLLCASHSAADATAARRRRIRHSFNLRNATT